MKHSQSCNHVNIFYRKMFLIIILHKLKKISKDTRVSYSREIFLQLPLKREVLLNSFWSTR